MKISFGILNITLNVNTEFLKIAKPRPIVFIEQLAADFVLKQSKMVSSAQSPTSSVKSPGYSALSPASSVQSPVSIVQLPEFRVQGSESSVQSPVSRVQRLESSV